MKKKFFATLMAVVLCVGMLPAGVLADSEQTYDELNPCALAAFDNINSYDALKEAINGQTGEIDITLAAGFATSGTTHITLESGADVTIDLNGYTITADDLGGGALFTIPSGASLTITDSQANSASEGEEVSVGAVDAGQLASVTGSIDAGISLTYYVTESTVTDSATGTTQETCRPYTAVSAGMIGTTGQNHSLFSVTGGTLNIKSGFFYGEGASSGNRAIDASGGTVNLSGGYICGFTESYRSGHGEEYDGGAVRVTDSAVLNISNDAILAANKAATGGAVDVAGGTLNMTGGVISGNEATEDAGTSEWNNDYGGGGIHAYGSGSTVNISGGYVTNNVSDCEGYFDGGGGILVNGGTLNFSGGYITGNKAASSGGGIRTAYAAYETQTGSTVYITGGSLCANYAKGAEGGGLCLDNGSYGEVTATTDSIYINNNETDTSEHWGGGGIFCANGATLYMNDALITDNVAGGFGGGVAGCSTGRIAIADDAGAAIYDNNAKGEHTSGSGSTKHDDTEYALNDKVFMENGFADYYCALESMVSGMMLGGSAANWSGSADGAAIAEGSVGVEDYLWATYIMGLTADPSSDAITSAQSAAKVYITGNDSYTHGGGVLSNGYLFMGNVKYYAIGDALEVDANKQLIDESGVREQVREGQFTFEITDEEGEVVSTGTTQSDGSIFFDRRLTFNEAGIFTFTIKETASEDPGITMDPSVYTLVVTVSESEEEIEVAGEPVDYIYYNITHITLTKSGIAEPLIDEDVISENDEVNSITIPSPAFVNYDTGEISITVHKTWQDETGKEAGWPADIESIKVYLYQNGEVYGEPVLLAENTPSHTWTELPTRGDDGNGETISYIYEVKEEYLPGYLTSYEAASSEENVGSYWVPFSEAGEAELITGEKYLVVSPDGNMALRLTEGHIDAQLTSEDAVFITPGEGELTVGSKTFSSWYSDDLVTGAMTWVATRNTDIIGEHIILKNAEYTGSSLLVQGGSGMYTGLKGCNGDAYGSAIKIDENGRLIGQNNQSSWLAGNPWSYIVFADGRFNSSASDTTNAVQVYIQINPITETTDVNITNQYIGNISLSGEKAWDDDKDRDGLRPDSITVHLLADDVEVDSVTVTEEDNWKWSFTDLPEYQNGEKIVYTVTEDAVAGYETEISTNADGSFTLTNKHTPETIDIEGSKIWDDADNQNGKRPTEITIHLFADDEEIYSFTLSADGISDLMPSTPLYLADGDTNTWNWSISDLPKYKDGKEITYTISEDVVESYLTEVNGFEIINTFTEPKITKEIAEDDYERKEDSGEEMHDGEDTYGDGWGSWDDADNLQEVTYHLVLTDILGAHNLTVHDYLEEGLDFEPDTVEVDLYDEGSDTTLEEGTDYTEHEGDCSDPNGCAMDGCTFEVTFEDSVFEDISGDAYLVISYKALTDTHADDYDDYEDDILNYAYMTYGINSYRSDIVTTETDMFGFGVYKYADVNGEEIALAGAEFVLERGNAYATFDTETDGDGTMYYMITGWVKDKASAGTLTSGSDGLIRIEGLDDDSYTVTETKAPDGYEIVDESITVMIDEDGNVTVDGDTGGKEAVVGHVVNVENTEILTEVSGTKTWDDANNQDGKRPESITINLLADGEKIDSRTVTEADGWRWTFIDLPMYKDGAEIDYTITEDTVEDYTTDVDGYDITNSYTTEKISIGVRKIWEDADNQDGVRPESITVQLYADGEAVENAILTLSEENDWAGSFVELDMYADGEKIDYTIAEVNVDGYESVITGDSAEGYIITNTHAPETTEVSGSKTWDDNDDQDGIRPESITINLLADGEVLDSMIVTDADNWAWRFADLPMYQYGEEIVYSISEESVADYTAAYDGYDVTNSHTPGKVSVPVTKVWNDEDDIDGIRPASVNMELFKNGESTGRILALGEDNNWTGSFDDLDEYNEGVKNVYTVQEQDVDGYTVEITGDAETGFVVTNTHIPYEETTTGPEPEAGGNTPLTGSTGSTGGTNGTGGTSGPGSTGAAGSTGGTSSTGSTKTDDAGNASLWLVLAVLAGAFVVGSVTVRTRKARQRRR